MIETIKKMLLAGIGAGIVTQEKLRETLDEFVRRGEIAEEQAQRLLDVLIETGKSEGGATSEGIAKDVIRLLEKSPFATRLEYDRLEKRVRFLEAALGAAAPEEVEPSSADSPDLSTEQDDS